MDHKAQSRAALALIAACALFALWHAIWVGTVTDDAGISLAYARNLAWGQGLRLTPLSPRVEAYSDPLWVLWLALGYVLHIGGAAFAKWSGAILAAAAVFIIGLVPSRAEGRPLRLFDAVGPAVLACDTTYAFWAGAGLESGAFSFALAFTLLLLARRSLWSAVPAGLLCVLRPEGPLYVVALAATRPFRRPEARGLRSEACFLTLAALPALAWLAFRAAYYAQFLPNSYFAKKSWNYGGFWYLNSWFLDAAWHWGLYLAPLAFFARNTRRAAGLAASACVAAVAFILYSRGDWMSEHRFAAHALPAAALAVGLLPAALSELFGARNRDLGWFATAVIIAAAFIPARTRSPDRRKHPELPLSYVQEQARWFRRRADSLGLARPRVAHFDIGGLALDCGCEVIDLAGLGDLYIARIGYQDHAAVRDYVFDEVKPEMINVHGPSQHLRDDPRMARDYHLAGSGLWGENWVRKALELDGIDERCPPQGLQLAGLDKLEANAARDLWLCARNHLPASTLPDVSSLARRFAATGSRPALEAALALDPTQSRAARRLLALRLATPRKH